MKHFIGQTWSVRGRTTAHVLALAGSTSSHERCAVSP